MGGWNAANDWNWHVRRERVARRAGRWTAPDIAIIVVGFFIHWEVGVAALALKLWHQASGHEGNLLMFAREKWDALVVTTRNLIAGDTLSSLSLGPRSSGNQAFDAWRRQEQERIEADRRRLRAIEREFAAYHDDVLHGQDQEAFERFMQARGTQRPAA
jgi:hypothetical protein